MMIRVDYHPDHSMPTEPPEEVYAGPSEREARRAAARALGQPNMRGLAQAPTEDGTCFYGVGATDEEGDSVTIAWPSLSSW